MSKLLFAFVGRVSTEDMQEPEASRARQIAKASTILPPSAQIVADYFDIGDTRALPWPRRPETGRLLRELRSGTNAWDAIVVGEFTRAFGAPIQYSTTYPLFQHFGIELWLPEIGGRVDLSSATTEMLLGMLGGTSKQERDLIRVRVRDGMTVLAEMGGRHRWRSPALRLPARRRRRASQWQEACSGPAAPPSPTRPRYRLRRAPDLRDVRCRTGSQADRQRPHGRERPFARGA
jgi:DNA invertase Pin-like site-specific DNA recombinase